MNDVRYCLEIWGTDYKKIKQTCTLAEELGYYGFYYGESLAEIDLDCWTVLSTLIPITNKIKLGPVITYILPDYRSLALLVKQSITFQDISKGRLEFRTGAGAINEYSLQWWYPFGINYYNATDRVILFNEGIQLLSKMLGNNNTNYNQSERTLVENFDGRFYKIQGASFVKPKIRIPITIAAKQDKMMRIAANYADTWECSYLTPIEYFSLYQRFESLSKKAQNNNGSTEPQNRVIKKSIELDVLIASTRTGPRLQEKIVCYGEGTRCLHSNTKKRSCGKFCSGAR